MDPSYIFQGLAGGLGGLASGLQDRYRMQQQMAEAAEAKRRWEEQMGLQQDQFEETRRGNTADEQWRKAQAAEEARRFQISTDMTRQAQQNQQFNMGVQEMRLGGAGAGVNYLNPRRAYQVSQMEGMPMPLGASGGMGAPAVQQGTMGKIMSGIDPLARKLTAGNQGTGMLPGSEILGGAVLENRQFNPYSGSGGGGGGKAGALSLAVTRLSNAARQGAENVRKLTMSQLAQITNQFDQNAVAGAQAKAEQAYQAELKKRSIANAMTIAQDFGIPFEAAQQYFTLQGEAGGGGGGFNWPMPPSRGGQAPGQSPQTPAPQAAPSAFPMPPARTSGGVLGVDPPMPPRSAPRPMSMGRDTVGSLFPMPPRR